MPTLNYTVTQHDPETPWLILKRERHSVDLEEPGGFFSWAAEMWPPDRFTVELDPWQLAPKPVTSRPESRP